MRRFLLIWLLAAVACAQTRLEEKSFAWTIPAGWSVRTYANLPYKMAVRDDRTVMRVGSEEKPGTLPAYCGLTEAIFKSNVPTLKVKSKTFFQTVSGLQGIKLVTGSRQGGRWVSQTFYFFPGAGDVKYMLLCGCPPDQSARWAPVFDKAARSFTLK